MTIQTFTTNITSSRDNLIHAIATIIKEAVECREAIPVTEVASRIASEIEPTVDDVERLHRWVRKALSGALDEAGLMAPDKFREEYYDGFEWPDELAYVVSNEIVRRPAEWRDESNADRRSVQIESSHCWLGRSLAKLPLVPLQSQLRHKVL